MEHEKYNVIMDKELKYVYYEKAPFGFDHEQIRVTFKEGWTYETLKVVINQLQDIQFEGQ